MIRHASTWGTAAWIIVVSVFIPIGVVVVAVLAGVITSLIAVIVWDLYVGFRRHR